MGHILPWHFTSHSYRALCLQAHYSSNNGLDHNLQFFTIFATDTGGSKIPLHGLGGLDTPKVPLDSLLGSTARKDSSVLPAAAADAAPKDGVSTAAEAAADVANAARRAADSIQKVAQARDIVPSVRGFAGVDNIHDEHTSLPSPEGDANT